MQKATYVATDQIVQKAQFDMWLHQDVYVKMLPDVNCIENFGHD